MAFPQRALPVWFGLGRSRDPYYLQAWQNAPLTYFPGDEIGPDWNADRYEVILGSDASGQLFQRAADLVMRNRFYPPEVMVAVSTFSLAGRPVETGDRVLQRIRIFRLRDMPILEVLTLNEITRVINEPRQAGFTYTTTAAHSEIGEWAPRVEWRENSEVALIIEVVSRTRPGAPEWSRRFARKMQLRGHKMSIDNFVTQLTGRPAPRPTPRPRAVSTRQILPVAMLLLALILLLGLVLSGIRRSKD